VRGPDLCVCRRRRERTTETKYNFGSGPAGK
jgi:hypothetical protein